jgi:hypothetical protein
MSPSVLSNFKDCASLSSTVLHKCGHSTGYLVYCNQGSVCFGAYCYISYETSNLAIRRSFRVTLVKLVHYYHCWINNARNVPQSVEGKLNKNTPLY